VQPIADFLRTCLPAVRTQPVRHSTCLYTVTPDRHFVVDRHPEFSNVVIGCGFSGHGFKFTSVLGSVFADLATTGSTGNYHSTSSTLPDWPTKLRWPIAVIPVLLGLE